MTRRLVVAAGACWEPSREALRQQREWAGRVGTATAGVPALASHERWLAQRAWAHRLGVWALD
jgi:hypothetical protein